jgi:predicted nucleic acid-binding protein
MVLVDTSAWIEFFRPGGLRLQDQVDFDDVVTCLPVIQEVLQGVDDEASFRQAREAMLSLPVVESPLGSAVVEDAVDLYRRARRSGVTIRSGVDCLIAACAIRHGLAVLHHDRDFPRLAQVSTLQTRSVRSRG